MSKHLKHLSLIFILALIIRWLTVNELYVMNPDGIQYVKLARNFSFENIFGFLDPYWSPLYPFIIGISRPFFSDVETAAIYVSIVLNSFLVVASFFLIKQHYGIKEAYVGAIITANFQYLVNSANLTTPESLYLLLIILTLILGWKALIDESFKKFVALGFLIGISYLTRPEAIIYLGWFIAIIIIQAIYRSDYKKLLPKMMLLISGFVICFLPYVYYIYDSTGVITISAKFAKHIVAGNYYFPSDSMQQDHILVTFLKTFLFNLDKQHNALFYLFPPIVSMIAFFGLFRRKWETTRLLRELYFISFIVMSMVCYALTVVEVRYMAVILPVLICWLSKGILEINDLIKSYSKSFSTRVHNVLDSDTFCTFLLIVFVFIYLLPTATYLRSKSDIWSDFEIETKLAGVWLKENSDTKSKIQTSSLTTIHYSKRDGTIIEIADNYVNKFQTSDRDYLVVFERSFKNPDGYKNFRAKLYKKIDFEKVYEYSEVENFGLTIYKKIKNESETNKIFNHCSNS